MRRRRLIPFGDVPQTLIPDVIARLVLPGRRRRYRQLLVLAARAVPAGPVDLQRSLWPGGRRPVPGRQPALGGPLGHHGPAPRPRCVCVSPASDLATRKLCSTVARRNATASNRPSGWPTELLTKYFTSAVASLIATTST